MIIIIIIIAVIIIIIIIELIWNVLDCDIKTFWYEIMVLFLKIQLQVKDTLC